MSQTWPCSAGVRNRFSEFCVGIVLPGLVSVSKANAPPALVNASSTLFISGPVYHQYPGGA